MPWAPPNGRRAVVSSTAPVCCQSECHSGAQSARSRTEDHACTAAPEEDKFDEDEDEVEDEEIDSEEDGGDDA